MIALVDVLVENGLIVTMDRNRRVIRGSISVEGGEIREVGNIENQNADEVIDAEGKIVMPGLVCAHARPYKVLSRATPLKVEPPTDFIQTLQRKWWPMDEKLSNKDTYNGTLAACLELIKTGVTFFAGIHSSQESIGKSLDYVSSAVEKVGLRSFIAFEASERHTRAEGARGMKENIRFLENRKKKRRGETRVGGMVGLSASFTVSDELLRHGKRVADRFDVPIVISAAEGRADLYHNLQKFGKRTIERFRDVGILSSKTVLAHCTHVNDDELSIIEKTGAKVVHNPISEMLDGVGVPRVPMMRRMGILVGLGNDGYILDEFENIRALYMIHKAITGDPRTIAPEEALEMATIQGAELYGVENKIGSIEPGKQADIIIINPSRLFTPLRRKNVVDHLINTVKSTDVETVIVGGDLIMQNRNIKTLDEERTMKKSRKTAKKIWKKLEL